MNCTSNITAIALSGGLLFAMVDAGRAQQPAPDTSFSFQGQLEQNGAPVNDTCDFRFMMLDAAEGGIQVGPTLTQPLDVRRGHFATTLDFGANVFTGEQRWLDIALCCSSPCATTTAAAGPTPVGRFVTTSTPKAINSNLANSLKLPLEQIIEPPLTQQECKDGYVVRQNNGCLVAAIRGISSWIGVQGHSDGGSGVQGTSDGGVGVEGSSDNFGVWGKAHSLGFGIGVLGEGGRTGVVGKAPEPTGIGVLGQGGTTGVQGNSDSGNGVHGVSFDGVGVRGASRNGYGGFFENRFEGTALAADTGFGVVEIRQENGKPLLSIPNNGRIRTGILQIEGGSDVSEQFEVRAAGDTRPVPGMVVCIDAEHEGELVVCSKAHDQAVAGVISGAGGINPGMLLGQQGSLADGRVPIALSGRVYVLADASNAPIVPGDLLTTSATPGHAMKATNTTQSRGVILGKAMTRLKTGQGLVLVLVNLQ